MTGKESNQAFFHTMNSILPIDVCNMYILHTFLNCLSHAVLQVFILAHFIMEKAMNNEPGLISKTIGVT